MIFVHEDGAMSNWVRFLVVDCGGPFIRLRLQLLGLLVVSRSIMVVRLSSLKGTNSANTNIEGEV